MQVLSPKSIFQRYFTNEWYVQKQEKSNNIKQVLSCGLLSRYETLDKLAILDSG